MSSVAPARRDEQPLRVEPVAGIIDRWIGEIKGAARDNFHVYLVGYFLNFAIYSYLFTNITFTNHTVQNSVLQSYPSYRTVWEGRWLHDLILFLSGGLGSQSAQMFLAVALQVASGIVFARILQARGRLQTLIVVLLVSLHPTVMDYYSFNSDAVSFTLGDLLIVAGGYVLLRPGWARVATATLCFFLALSIYQPKIAVLAVILVVASRQAILTSGTEECRSNPGALGVVQIAMRFLLAPLLACAAYWIVLQMLVSREGGLMTVLNPEENPLMRISAAYIRAATGFDDLVSLLQPPVVWIVMLSIGGSLGVVVAQFVRRPSLRSLLGCAMLALLPPAAYLTFILNDISWTEAGRIFVSEAYVLAFVLSLSWPFPVLRPISLFASIAIIFYMAVIAGQETQAASIRSTLEMQRIERIFARIEMEVPDLYARKHDLLVVGKLPDDAYRQFVRLSWRHNRPNLSYSLFATFHQTTYLNLIAGRDVFDRVQSANLEGLLREVAGRPAWPAPGSVFVDGDTVVVMLEPYRDGIELTDRR